MGLKGYRLWAMCQLDSNVQRPTMPKPPMPQGRGGTFHHVIIVHQNTVQWMTAGMFQVTQSDTTPEWR
jgi:hypothetical protein